MYASALFGSMASRSVRIRTAFGVLPGLVLVGGESHRGDGCLRGISREARRAIWTKSFSRAFHPGGLHVDVHLLPLRQAVPLPLGALQEGHVSVRGPGQPRQPQHRLGELGVELQGPREAQPGLLRSRTAARSRRPPGRPRRPRRRRSSRPACRKGRVPRPLPRRPAGDPPTTTATRRFFMVPTPMIRPTRVGVSFRRRRRPSGRMRPRPVPPESPFVPGSPYSTLRNRKVMSSYCSAPRT